MAIRLRSADGIRVALCAAETTSQPGDHYIDDAEHYALAAKFAQDALAMGLPPSNFPREWAAMKTQETDDSTL